MGASSWPVAELLPRGAGKPTASRHAGGSAWPVAELCILNIDSHLSPQKHVMFLSPLPTDTTFVESRLENTRL